MLKCLLASSTLQSQSGSESSPEVNTGRQSLSDIVLVGNQEGGKVHARDREHMPPSVELRVPSQDRVWSDSVNEFAEMQISQPDRHCESVHAQGSVDQPGGFVGSTAGCDHGLLLLVKSRSQVNDGDLKDSE